MREQLKRAWRDSLLYHPTAPLWRYWQRNSWQRAGKPKRVPQGVKEQVIAHYQRRYHIPVLVETGTFKGDTMSAQRRRFAALFSIEFDRDLYKQASRRLNRWGHIRLVHGDSRELLPEVLKDIKGPSLIWLDAHYSGPGTGRAVEDTPIGLELKAALNRPPGDVILIDDAGDFTGQNGYPTLEALEKMVAYDRPNLEFSVEDWIIRLTPKSEHRL